MTAPQIRREEILVYELTGDGSALLDLWQDALAVIIIDAMQSGSTPGTVHRFDASVSPLPSMYRYFSTHAFSGAGAIELARALHQLPSQVIVYGVEGRDCTLGAQLSPEVKPAIGDVVEQVWNEVVKCLERAGTENDAGRSGVLLQRI